MRFYLGTHQVDWLDKVDFPLFVSHRRLMRYTNMPRATCEWALDSGGFSELSMFGEWLTPQKSYVAAVRRYAEEIGGLNWAAVQDWMCEPGILAKTGLSVEEHQQRTIDSYRGLCDAAPEVHWVPVLQGWEMDDYARQ